MNITSEEMKKWIGIFPTQSFGDGICYMIGGFGNVGVIEIEEGLVLFDISMKQFGPKIFNELREICAMTAFTCIISCCIICRSILEICLKDKLIKLKTNKVISIDLLEMIDFLS